MKGYQSTYEQSLPSGVQPVFSIRGSLTIEKNEIRVIGEEKEDDEESKYEAKRISEEQSFHYKKGVAIANREIANRPPSNTLDKTGSCCTLPFMRNRADEQAKVILYSEDGMREIPKPNKYLKGKELMHLSKASEVTTSGRFLEHGPGTYEPADKNKDCLIF